MSERVVAGAMCRKCDRLRAVGMWSFRFGVHAGTVERKVRQKVNMNRKKASLFTSSCAATHKLRTYNRKELTHIPPE